ncbi:hypothetical protein EWM64_g1968 [Hericium alpestre]|uniref:Myosin tail domain-containing protein n=1 Tax=Hericium alpestre TaxID=135208 RepID=A0A4Z0A6Z7_9AGAM|nr:hypothetical protein EWM64_g1968 [Hericium alpestre]
MWSRLSSALKRQPGEQSDVEPSHPSVISGILEQHPNLSVFHNHNTNEDHENHHPGELPFPTPSPPSSPSKNGRRGMFKRMSKGPKDDGSESPAVMPLKLPLSLPKKVKSHLNLHTNTNGTMLHFVNWSLLNLSSESQMSLNHQPDSANDKGRPSLESAASPATPIDGRFGSIRSILRDRNTPGTGQSVRFFSRDAYKTISPDVSAASEQEEAALIDRLQLTSPDSKGELSRSRNRPRPAAQDLFSPSKSSTSPPGTPREGSLMMPIPPSDMSNIFDLSQRDISAIPPNTGHSLLDNAIELIDSDISREESMPPTPPPKTDETAFHSMEKSSMSIHDRSHSFSFGQKVFQAMPKSSPPITSTPVDHAKLSGGLPIDIARPPSRNRAMSDTIFHSMSRYSPAPEADINDMSGSSLLVYSTPASEREQSRERERAEPDPFRANATTYYTPGTMIPPTPPHSTHTRKASREEDLIWNLRTQLTLQQELCTQYELDLGARDEIVSSLSMRLETAEKEAEKRKNVLRGWKKKVMELEKLCRHLENEADSSRQESFERSIMDEASGEALRQLHRQISALEREKSDVAKKSEQLQEAKDRAEGWVQEREEEIARLKEELKKQDESLKSVTAGVLESLKDEGNSSQLGSDSASLQLAEAKWDVERGQLLTNVDELREAKDATEAELESAKAALMQRDQEMAVMKAELEAQWKNTEEDGDQISTLKREKDTLQNELVALEAKVEAMELEWNESENQKQALENDAHEAWTMKEELEREKEQLEEELRSEQEHADELTHALQEREDRIASLQQELKYANDNANRLEQQVRDRNEEVERLAHQVVAREDDVEEVRSELKTLDRQHSHAMEEQRRAVIDLTAREEEARAHLEAAIKEKAEADLSTRTLTDRVHLLEGEIEKLRKQVHQLQAESADKDMHLVQLNKSKEVLTEDYASLNIALDSKQQELELLKRRLSLKGTAGATPAPTKTMGHRRESSIATPSFSRPVSRLSDASKDGRLSDTPSTSSKPTTLGKSIRTNGSGSSTPATTVSNTKSNGSMGPPASTKPRASISTPTPLHGRMPSAPLARSAVKTSAATPKASMLRRTSSATAAEPSRMAKASAPPARGVTSPVLSEVDEKENTEPNLKRRSLVAA